MKENTNIRSLIIIFLLFFFASPSSIYGQSAEALLKQYDINYYLFNLEVDPFNPSVSGNVEIHIQMGDASADTLALELTDRATIDSVMLDQQSISFMHQEDLIFLPLTENLNAGSFHNLNIFYTVESDPTLINEGITSRKALDVFPVSWTLSEPFYSKNWFPCKQDLSDKVDSASLHFTCPEGYMVGSNGILKEIVPVEENKLRFEWETRYPTAYYLYSFTVSNYMDYSYYSRVNSTDSVLVQNFVYNDSNYLATHKEDIDATGDMISLFSELIGPYPFLLEKYGHCVAPINGGMEHQTMTTLSDFRFNLVSHELAHMWFGDYITCADWENIWINEGFASYFELIAIEFLKTKEEYHSWLNDAFLLVTKEPGGSVWVPPSEANTDSRIFSHRLSYEKGAYILHMLRHSIGDDELFFLALRNYLDEYANSTATAEDFKNSFENTCQRDFNDFFDQWFYGEGYPTLAIQWAQLGDSLKIDFVQTTSKPEVTPFFDLLIDLNISYYGGDTLIQLNTDYLNQSFTIPMNKRVYQITPDPDDWLLAVFSTVTRTLTVDSSAFFAIFPNPVQDRVTIENLQIGLPYHAKLYSSTGVLLDEFITAETFREFNTNLLRKGIYQVVITRGNIREVFQITKI